MLPRIGILVRASADCLTKAGMYTMGTLPCSNWLLQHV
jgi:hypothetical protein